MAINVRKDFYKDIETSINTTEIYKTSRMITAITGVEVQPNKAIVKTHLPTNQVFIKTEY